MRSSSPSGSSSVAHRDADARPGKRPGPARRDAGDRRGEVAPLAVELFAVAAPGLAGVLAEEARALPEVEAVVAEPGGVTLRGPPSLIGRANLHLRSATRVLLRLARFHATRLPQLVEVAAAFPWERYLRGPAPQVRVTCVKSRIYHSDAAAERLLLGVKQRLGAAAGPTGAAQPLVLLRGVHDQWELSLDTSGALLHQRGYRSEAVEAPLRETLAAGLLLLAGYQGGPLCDLCCGSGTFVIEAALLRRRIAPGLRRGFAFQDWPTHEAAPWQRLRAEALAQILPASEEPLLGIDIDAQAIALAQRNAARALDVVSDLAGQAETPRSSPEGAPRSSPEAGAPRFLQGDLFALRPGVELPLLRGVSALLCANPPYGHRLGQRSGQHDLYRRLGQHLRQHFPDSRALILCGSPQAAQALRLPLAAVRLQNGGLPLTVLHGPLRPASAARSPTETAGAPLRSP